MRPGSRPIVAVLLALAAPGTLARDGAQRPHTVVHGADHVMVRPEQVQWRSLRPGAEIAVVSGDPDKPGAPFVIRMRYHGPARIPPHWHPTDEHITVLSGTFMVGMGEQFDESTSTELPAGGYVVMPAKMPHYAWTRGDTVVQVHGLGPFAINYVNPSDDPKSQR